LTSSTPQQQDKKIVEDFKRAQDEDKDVIGILAISDYEPASEQHSRFKREHHEYKKTYVYVAPGN
jgi:cobalamin-dependent methionine synthase I